MSHADKEGAPTAAPGLRFAVGHRIACNLGRGSWASGTIVDLHYREEDWPEGKVAPYQVKLDTACGGGLIFAPLDSPQVVRAEGAAPRATPSLPEAGGDAGATLRALREELPAARALPFLLGLVGPVPPAAAESGGELFVATDATGPWRLSATLLGPEGGGYAGEHRVNLKVNAAWPHSPAEVRFSSLVHHHFVREDGLLEPTALEDAMALLVREQSATCGLCAVLRAVHLLLGSPEKLVTEGHSAALAQERAAHGRRQLIIASYAPRRRHARLFDARAGWAQEWFDPAVWQAATGSAGASCSELAREEAREVFSLPLFTPGYCDMLVEEIHAFYASGLPARRPNSMNNYGIVVSDIGMEPMLYRLQQEILQPIARALFPGVGSSLDRHHSFVVRYKVGEDLGLDMHTDDSDVTFNICLGIDFKGAGLRFCGDQGSATHRHSSGLYFHQKGRCVVHLGHRRHGADDIAEGERLNLIVWNTSSEYRQSRAYARYNMQSSATGYEREAGLPDRVCLSQTHDRDYGHFVPYSEGAQARGGRGWCPPRHAEYEGFREETTSNDEEEGQGQGEEAGPAGSAMLE